MQGRRASQAFVQNTITTGPLHRRTSLPSTPPENVSALASDSWPPAAISSQVEAGTGTTTTTARRASVVVKQTSPPRTPPRIEKPTIHGLPNYSASIQHSGKGGVGISGLPFSSTNSSHHRRISSTFRLVAARHGIQLSATRLIMIVICIFMTGYLSSLIWFPFRVRNSVKMASVPIYSPRVAEPLRPMPGMGTPEKPIAQPVVPKEVPRPQFANIPFHADEPVRVKSPYAAERKQAAKIREDPPVRKPVEAKKPMYDANDETRPWRNVPPPPPKRKPKLEVQQKVNKESETTQKSNSLPEELEIVKLSNEGSSNESPKKGNRPARLQRVAVKLPEYKQTDSRESTNLGDELPAREEEEVEEEELKEWTQAEPHSLKRPAEAVDEKAASRQATLDRISRLAKAKSGPVRAEIEPLDDSVPLEQVAIQGEEAVPRNAKKPVAAAAPILPARNGPLRQKTGLQAQRKPMMRKPNEVLEEELAKKRIDTRLKKMGVRLSREDLEENDLNEN